jgi:hypothetical protein
MTAESILARQARLLKLSEPAAREAPGIDTPVSLLSSATMVAYTGHEVLPTSDRHTECVTAFLGVIARTTSEQSTRFLTNGLAFSHGTAQGNDLGGVDSQLIIPDPWLDACLAR